MQVPNQPRQEPGIRLVGEPEQVQVPMEPIVPAVKPEGVKRTTTVETSLKPDTVITPVVSATTTELAYFDEVEVPQLLNAVPVEVVTISLMHVRAPDAANTISAALAFLV